MGQMLDLSQFLTRTSTPTPTRSLQSTKRQKILEAELKLNFISIKIPHHS